MRAKDWVRRHFIAGGAKRKKPLHWQSHPSPWFRSAWVHRQRGASCVSTVRGAGESSCQRAVLCGWPICCGNCHDPDTDPSLAGGRTHRHACRHRRTLPADTEHPRPQPLRRQRLRLSQPAPEPPQTPDLGRHRRLALSAAPASWSLHLADIGSHHLRPHTRTMGLVDCRNRLAKTLGGTAIALASLSALFQ